MNNFGIFDFLNKLSDALGEQTTKTAPASKPKEHADTPRIIYKNTQQEKPKKHYSDKEIMEVIEKHSKLSKQLSENSKI